MHYSMQRPSGLLPVAVWLSLCLNGGAKGAGDNADIGHRRGELMSQKARLEQLTAQLRTLESSRAKATADPDASDEPGSTSATTSSAELPNDLSSRERINVLHGEHKPEDDPQSISLTTRVTRSGNRVYSIISDSVSIWHYLRRLAKESDIPICVDGDIPASELAERISIHLENVAFFDLIEIILGTRGLDSQFDGRSIFVTKGPKLGYKSREHYLMEKATQVYRQAVVKYHDHPATERAYYALAEAHLRAGDYAMAVQEFGTVIAKFPSSDLARLARFNSGVCFAQLGDAERTRDAFGQFLDRAATDELADEAYLAIGKAWEESGDHEKAVVAFRNVIQQYPNRNTAAEAQLRLARCLYRCSRYHEAVQEFDQLAAGAEDAAIAAESAFCAGESLYQAGNMVEAAARFRTIVTRHIKSEYADDAYYRYADCCLDSRDYLAALEAYTGAATQFPESSHAARGAYSRAVAYHKIGFPKDALRSLRQALDLCNRADPSDSGNSDDLESETPARRGSDDDADARPSLGRKIRMLMAECHFSCEEYLQAAGFYAAVAGSGDDKLALEATYQMARCSAARAKYPEAIEGCKKIIAKAKDGKLAKQAIKLAGDCFLRLGMLSEAADAYRGRIVLDDDASTEQETTNG